MIRLLILINCLCLLHVKSFAQDIAILQVIVNGYNEGEHFIRLANDDVLFTKEILKGFRLKEKLWSKQTGEFLSLKKLSPPLQFKLNQNTAILNITVPSTWFEQQLIKLKKVPIIRPAYDIFFPKKYSGVINYQLETQISEQDYFQSLNIPWQVGINMKQWFVSSFFQSQYSGGFRNTRLQSSLRWDDPIKMNRWFFGDFSPPINNGAGGLFGGISFQRSFSLNRTFKYTPDFSLQTTLETAAHAELYVNNQLREEWELLPGNVLFPNLSRYVGQGDIELVLTDMFGQKRHIQEKFYLNQELLKTGLDEFSYSLGFTRENIGVKSNQYDKLTFLGFHRYGLTPQLTAGMDIEIDKRVTILTPALNATIKDSPLDMALSLTYDKSLGYQFISRYSYQYKNLYTSFQWANSSSDYANRIIESSTQNKNRYQAGVNINYNTKKSTGFGLAYTESVSWDNQSPKNRNLSFSYNKSFTSQLILSLGARYKLKDSSQAEVFLRISYYPRKSEEKKYYFDNIGYNINYHHNDGIKQELILQKSPVPGNGSDYNTKISQKADDFFLSGYFHHQNEKGIYTVSYNNNLQDMSGHGKIAYAGSLALINDSIHISRPISDSFALVQVKGTGKNLKDGVLVRSNNRIIGHTNSKGELIIPDFMSYSENKVSIRSRDLPINYTIDKEDKSVFLEQTSGSFVTFEINQFMAIEGNLIDENDEALELLTLEFTINGKEETSFTGRDGYFYLENIPTGELSIYTPEKECILTILESEQLVKNVGKISCKSLFLKTEEVLPEEDYWD